MSQLFTIKKIDSKESLIIWRISPRVKYGSKNLKNSGLIVKTRNLPIRGETKKRRPWSRSGVMHEAVLRLTLQGRKSMLMWQQTSRKQEDGSARTGKQRIIYQEQKREKNSYSSQIQTRMRGMLKKNLLHLFSRSHHLHSRPKWEINLLIQRTWTSHSTQFQKCIKDSSVVSLYSVISHKTRRVMVTGYHQPCKQSSWMPLRVTTRIYRQRKRKRKLYRSYHQLIFTVKQELS